jgi:hypothetical protein
MYLVNTQSRGAHLLSVRTLDIRFTERWDGVS